tara:strand:+ start:400 stop:597 length:198 start_codon:yes stop_codon:yes gene_type:complete
VEHFFERKMFSVGGTLRVIIPVLDFAKDGIHIAKIDFSMGKHLVENFSDASVLVSDYWSAKTECF